MPSYLVAVGAGFIGSHIVQKLVGRGESVRVLDNFSIGKHKNLDGAVVASMELGSLDVIEAE